jgi:hypothetical protein
MMMMMMMMMMMIAAQGVKLDRTLPYLGYDAKTPPPGLLRYYYYYYYYSAPRCTNKRDSPHHR